MYKMYIGRTYSYRLLKLFSLIFFLSPHRDFFSSAGVLVGVLADGIGEGEGGTDTAGGWTSFRASDSLFDGVSTCGDGVPGPLGV